MIASMVKEYMINLEIANVLVINYLLELIVVYLL